MATHEQILATVWGQKHITDVQYLRVYIKQLRSKLETNPVDPKFIETVSGVGYRLAD